MKTKIISVDKNDGKLEEKLTEAAAIIKRGGLVVFPTETVYGLGADATNKEAAKKIFAAKGRPSDNPLIIHVSEAKHAEKYAFTSETYYLLAKHFMPGPLTVILKSRDSIPKETRGGLDTVAVRCPENLIARTLIALSGTPIAAPSANLSGSPSPTNAQHVIDDMNGRVDMIIDGGAADFGLESTIVKINADDSLTLLRPGKITVSDLLQVVDFVHVADAVTDKLAEGEIALSPGMKYRHYAPKAPVLLLDANADNAIKYIKNADSKNIAIISYTEDISDFKNELPGAAIFDFGNRDDEIQQAKLLFSILRTADKRDFEIIYAPLPKKDGVGLAIYNRMIRAAAHKIIKI